MKSQRLRKKLYQEIHVLFQKGIWSFVLLFILIRASIFNAHINEFIVILVLGLELSLLGYFVQYSLRYFGGCRKARQEWFVPSLVLFLFLTFPFAFSVGRSVLEHSGKELRVIKQD